jgi:hypothetical protein
MHTGASARERLGDPRQGLATSTNTSSAPPARGGGPPAAQSDRSLGGFQLIDSANPLKPATMMPTDRDLDAPTGPAIDALNQATRHHKSLPTGHIPSAHYVIAVTTETQAYDERDQPCRQDFT